MWQMIHCRPKTIQLFLRTSITSTLMKVWHHLDFNKGLASSLVFDLLDTTLTIESTSSISFFTVSKVMCITSFMVELLS